MPHVIVKLHTGRSDEQKTKLAEEITRAVMQAMGSSEGSISVAVEDFPPADWMEKVYKPDIEARKDTLYKLPGYGPK